MVPKTFNRRPNEGPWFRQTLPGSVRVFRMRAWASISVLHRFFESQRGALAFVQTLGNVQMLLKVMALVSLFRFFPGDIAAERFPGQMREPPSCAPRSIRPFSRAEGFHEERTKGGYGEPGAR